VSIGKQYESTYSLDVTSKIPVNHIVKFEEINLKFKKNFEKVPDNKVRKS